MSIIPQEAGKETISQKQNKKYHEAITDNTTKISFKKRSVLLCLRGQMILL